MVCITLHNKRYSEILEALALPEVEMAEIRLDSCMLSPEETEDLFMNCDLPLVATCRISGIAEKLKREQPDKTDGSPPEDEPGPTRWLYPNRSCPYHASL